MDHPIAGKTIDDDPRIDMDIPWTALRDMADQSLFNETRHMMEDIVSSEQRLNEKAALFANAEASVEAIHCWEKSLSGALEKSSFHRTGIGPSVLHDEEALQAVEDQLDALMACRLAFVNLSELNIVDSEQCARSVAKVCAQQPRNIITCA